MSANPLLVSYDDDAHHNMHRQVKTTSALLFHTNATGLQMMTAHAVEQDDNGLPVISSGRPMTPADERRIVELLLARQEASLTIFPEHLLAQSADCIIWWMPPLVRDMYLGDGGLAKRIKTRWPNLVCMVVGRTLYVAAVAGDARPKADTPLFHCPTGNIYGDTRVCTGSARLPIDAHLSTIPGWTGVMVESAFTHDNHALPLVETGKPRGKKEARAFNKIALNYWLSRDEDESPFPDERLNALGFTLGEWHDIATGAAFDGRGRRVGDR